MSHQQVRKEQHSYVCYLTCCTPGEALVRAEACACTNFLPLAGSCYAHKLQQDSHNDHNGSQNECMRNAHLCTTANTNHHQNGSVTDITHLEVSVDDLLELLECLDSGCTGPTA